MRQAFLVPASRHAVVTARSRVAGIEDPLGALMVADRRVSRVDQGGRILGVTDEHDQSDAGLPPQRVPRQQLIQPV